jgi:hypothetical protein
MGIRVVRIATAGIAAVAVGIVGACVWIEGEGNGTREQNGWSICWFAPHNFGSLSIPRQSVLYELPLGPFVSCADTVDRSDSRTKQNTFYEKS